MHTKTITASAQSTHSRLENVTFTIFHSPMTIIVSKWVKRSIKLHDCVKLNQCYSHTGLLSSHLDCILENTNQQCQLFCAKPTNASAISVC